MTTTAPSAASAGNVFTNMNQSRTDATQAQQLQSQFLQLLTTQLKNQDPTNPTDTSQMTSQLTQISTVSGIQSLNSTVSNMASTFNAAQSFQAAGLIGRQVMASGTSLAYDGTNPPSAQVTVPDNAGKVTLQVYDANARLVDTIQMGTPKAGNQLVKWDGTDGNGNKLPAGTYTIAAQGVATDGTTSNLDTATYVKVNSVSIGSDGVKLQVSDGRDIAMTDITQID
ncbi:MAG: flagellar biosynthesis protein FlgD [Burkholderiales bacterium]|nr:flagellar biosynthesis protein FlgD [Burkholderiales bacterium]